MKVVFAVNGLGLGNATRVHRLIEVLVSKGVSPKSLGIVTHAQALKYFQTNLPEIRCDQFPRSFNRTSSIIEFVQCSVQNTAFIRELIKRQKIKILITNSIYPIILPRGVHHVALNNSHSGIMNLFRFFKFGLMKSTLIELADYIYHLCIPNQTFFLSFIERPREGWLNGVSYSPLVSRVTPSDYPSPPSGRILVISGGGEDFSESFLRQLPSKYQFDVLVNNQAMSGTYGGHIQIVNKQLGITHLLNNYDIVISRAGLSTISELIHLRKKAICVPVADHLEQLVNGIYFQELGLGYCLLEQVFSSMIESCIEELKTKSLQSVRFNPECGANVIVRYLIEGKWRNRQESNLRPFDS